MESVSVSCSWTHLAICLDDRALTISMTEAEEITKFVHSRARPLLQYKEPYRNDHS